MESEILFLNPSAIEPFTTLELSREKYSVLGLLRNNCLVTALVFGLPHDEEIRKAHTVEVVEIVRTEDSRQEDLLELFSFYQARNSTGDLVLREGLVPKTATLETLGFFPLSQKQGYHGWFNGNVFYYTYKITTTDSDKYYYGVRHLIGEDSSTEACLKDPYMGSGGTSPKNKFRLWRKRHENFLVKEIMGVFTNKAQAYTHERELVGDRWKADPLCLNSRGGGALTSPKRNLEITLRVCEGNATHGETKHQGDTCVKCAMGALISVRACSFHGEVKFRGDTCWTCMIEEKISLKNCSKHGLVKHRYDLCYTCVAESQVSERNCPSMVRRFIGVTPVGLV